MDDPLSIMLFLVFIVHLLVFLRLAIKSNQGYQWLGVVTFVLLITGTVQRFYWPGAQWEGHDIHTWFRVAAWIASGCTVLSFLWHFWKTRSGSG